MNLIMGQVKQLTNTRTMMKFININSTKRD